jgi:hypothetical protein
LAVQALLMPQEKDMLDEEIDLMQNPNEGHNSNTQSNQSRMGGRIGARLESLPNREDNDVFIGGDTIRQPLNNMDQDENYENQNDQMDE